MNNSQQLIKLYGEIKLELINYYDDLKSEIDVAAQEKLLIIEKEEICSKNKQKILDLNKELIERSDEIFEASCKDIENYFIRNKIDEKVEKSELKKRAIKNFCIFAKNSLLNFDFKNENQLGQFISFDWYLDENQINYIKIKTQNLNSNNIQFKLDEEVNITINNLTKNIIMLKYGFKLIYDDKMPSTNEVFKFKNVFNFSRNFIQQYILNLRQTQLDLSYKSDDEKYFYLKTFDRNPFKLFKNLISLELICNKDLFENNLFEDMAFEKLQELTISCERLEKIDARFFKGLEENLNKLNLFNCQITKINKDTFKNMKKLIKLDLSWNLIEITDSNIFHDLENLENLFLIKNGLTEIKNNLFLNLSKLKEINLKMNIFNTIKYNWFRGLFNLKILNLSNCGISVLENNSFIDLENLEELDLSNNNIESITFYSLCNLSKLKILDLKTCKIKVIQEDSFKKMANLEELYLTKNKINTLKSEFFNGLNNLKLLDLRGNDLKSIVNDPFKNLLNLQELFLYEFDFACHKEEKKIENNDLTINEFNFSFL